MAVPAQADPWALSGSILSFAGAFTGAVGTGYALDAQRRQGRSEASSLEFQASLSEINARTAEQQAQAILRAGREEVGLRQLAAEQEQGALRASTAAAGIAGGRGSAAELQATLALARDIDVFRLRTTAMREANAARTGALNERTRSVILRGSARNIRASAATIRPIAGVTGSLLSSAGGALRDWAYYNRRSESSS